MIPVTYRHNVNLRPSRSTASGLKLGASLSFRFIGFVLLALLALLYIAQSSQGATKRVELQSLHTQTDELVNQQDQLRLEALRLQSLDAISQSASTLGLESVSGVEHLTKK